MASPEALLLRHRMYTTNICKKVIRSLLWRLFKIGHLCAYFFVFFHTSMRLTRVTVERVAVPKWNSPRELSKRLRHGTSRDVSLAGSSQGSYTDARPFKGREGSPLFPTFVGLQFKLRKSRCWCPVATDPTAVQIARRALHGARSRTGRNECVSKRGSAF